MPKIHLRRNDVLEHNACCGMPMLRPDNIALKEVDFAGSGESKCTRCLSSYIERCGKRAAKEDPKR